jgi:hypothetical protein
MLTCTHDNYDDDRWRKRMMSDDTHSQQLLLLPPIITTTIIIIVHLTASPSPVDWTPSASTRQASSPKMR